MSISDKVLHSSDKTVYGDKYSDHYLEQYKLYVEMADRISARRQTANSFFLSVNTVIIAAVGYVALGAESAGANFYLIISMAGFVLCYYWYRLVRSYKDLNSGKFRVIHEIEKQLPLAPYDAEWESVGGGEDPNLYLPFTTVEMRVPWIFMAIHVLVFIQAIPKLW